MLLLIVHEEEDFLDGTQRIAMFLWIANVEWHFLELNLLYSHISHVECSIFQQYRLALIGQKQGILIEKTCEINHSQNLFDPLWNKQQITIVGTEDSLVEISCRFREQTYTWNDHLTKRIWHTLDFFSVRKFQDFFGLSIYEDKLVSGWTSHLKNSKKREPSPKFQAETLTLFEAHLVKLMGQMINLGKAHSFLGFLGFLNHMWPMFWGFGGRDTASASWRVGTTTAWRRWSNFSLRSFRMEPHFLFWTWNGLMMLNGFGISFKCSNSLCEHT